MSTINPHRYLLKGGPRLEALIFALFGVSTPKQTRYVTFEAIGEFELGALEPVIWNRVKYRFPIVITGIDTTDESAEGWLFRGYHPSSHQKAIGHFDTQTREGWIVLE